ncbi:MAG: hypothetical protein Q9168_001361 [Polycauliona sp. 1 TL-2023]
MATEQAPQTTHGASFDLMRLPQELILRTVELVHHDDLENVFLTCKTISSLAKGLRQQHLENKKKYNTVILGDVNFASYNQDFNPMNKDNVVHPVFALRDMVCDREIMSDYCKVLKLGGLDARGELKDNYINLYGPTFSADIRRIVVETTPKLIHMADTDLCFETIDVQHQCDSIADGMYGLPFGMTLMFLENTQVLELVGLCDWFRNSTFSDAWEVMPGKTWPMMQDDEMNCHHPLGQLRELRIVGDQNEDGENLTEFSFLLRQPKLRKKLRKIYGHHAIAMSDQELSNIELCWIELEELHFDCSGIDGESMEVLLRGTRCLKTFYYENGLFGDTEYGMYAPYRYLSSLRKYAVQTLESLTLTDPVDLGTDDDYESDDGENTPMLRSFEALRYLAVDCSLLADDRSTDDLDEEKEDGFFTAEDPRLGDVLPPSLETLVILRPGKSSELANLFKDLSRLKNDQTPNLRSITIKTKTPVEIEQRLKEECEALGIEFKVVQE